MKTSAAFWDKAAEKYARDPIDDLAGYHETLGRTRGYLTPSDRVLELGAGTGSTAILLAPDVADFTASDYSHEMLEQARAKPEVADLTNLKFVQADVFDPDLAQQTYDVVLAHSLLHLLPDAEAAVAHIRTLIKPGGYFISKTACMGGELSWKLRLILKLLPLAQALGKAPYVRMLAPLEVDQMITNAGFEIVEASNNIAAHPTRYVVARRI